MTRDVLGWRAHEKVLKLRVFTREIGGRWLAQVAHFDAVAEAATEEEAIRAATRQARAAYARNSAPRDISAPPEPGEAPAAGDDITVTVRDADNGIALEMNEPISTLHIDHESAIALAVAILLRTHPGSGVVRGTGHR